MNPANKSDVPAAAGWQAIRNLLHPEGKQTLGTFAGWTLRSHFQPIFSVAHGRAVGFEGLIRPADAGGSPVAPLEVFGRDRAHLFTLDRLAAAVHVRNFDALRSDGWLFLNMHTEVFLAGVRGGDFLTELLAANGFSPQRVVIEILEQSVKDELQLREAVEFFRSQGYLIALDDFGAGHSNFDRVWNLHPDIVKLDRSMITQAGHDLRIRRMMPVMVSLLHEVGSLVLMEGVETAAEALMALDVDADFVQGYYFARPGAMAHDEAKTRALFDQLWVDFREVTLPEVSFHRREVGPYIHALGTAASRMESGMPLAIAASAFLELPGAERCYVLDGNGCQMGESLLNPRHAGVTDPRYAPLKHAQGANWSRRYYFRRAVEHPGRVQVTRPYLSIAGANQCITVSIGAVIDAEMRVLCGDVSWRDRGPMKQNGER